MVYLIKHFIFYWHLYILHWFLLLLLKKTNHMENYIALQGNVVYRIKNASYQVNEQSVTFHDVKGLTILSLPKNCSFCVDNGSVSATLVKGLSVAQSDSVVEKNETVIVNQQDGFAEGAILGGIAGAILF